jgi:hypothetical protein
MKNISVKWCFLIFIFVGNSYIYAQNIWTSERDTSVITLEYLRPSIKNVIGNEFTAQTFTLSGRIKLRNGNVLKIELPYATAFREAYRYTYSSLYYSYTYTISEIRSKTVGNLYAGIELCKEGKNTSVDLGVRLPLTSDKELAFASGVLTDVDRYEAFMPNIVAISAIINFKKRQPEGFDACLHIGPTLWINTKSTQGSDKFEMLLAYSLQGGFYSEEFDIIAGYSGRFIVTESGELSNRMFHQLGILSLVRFGNIHPGLYYRLPLDKNLKNTIDGVFGLSLSIVL